MPLARGARLIQKELEPDPAEFDFKFNIEHGSGYVAELEKDYNYPTVRRKLA